MSTINIFPTFKAGTVLSAGTTIKSAIATFVEGSYQPEQVIPVTGHRNRSAIDPTNNIVCQTYWHLNKTYAVIGTLDSDSNISWDSPIYLYNGTLRGQTLFDANSGNFLVIGAVDGNLKGIEIDPSSNTSTLVSSAVSAGNPDWDVAGDGVGNYLAIGSSTNDKGSLVNVTYDRNANPKFNFGSSTQYLNGRVGDVGITYCSNQDKFVCVYSDFGSSHGKGFVCELASNPLNLPTTGTHTTFDNQYAFDISLSYDETNGYVALASYSRDAGNTGTLYVATIDGMSLTWGTGVTYETAESFFNTVEYNSFDDTFVVAWMSKSSKHSKRQEFTLDSSGSVSLGNVHTLTTTEVGEDNNRFGFGIMPCSLGTVYTFFEKSSNSPSDSVMKSLVKTADSYVIEPPATPSSSGLVPNKIFMWSSDAAAYQNGVGRSDVGGVVMTDGDFSNPTTIQLDSPQMVVGGEGKVVTISQLGEIKVYDESTGQLEQTFNDSYLDSVKTTDLWGSANDAVIGAGKIFISAPEYNPQGIGSIIVVDLLDRNVDTYLITPTLGNYSRLSSVSYGGIHFIDGRIYGHTEQWSSADQGIWHFAPDGSDEQFIPTPGADGGSGLVKWGDNFVIHSGYHDIQLIDSSGAVLQTLSKPVDFSFGQDFGLTSTGKLAVLKHETNSPMTHSIFLYDEGFTNEIEITQPADSTDIYWGYGTKANSGGFEVFGEYILVSATEADNNGITNCGAVYRYNDSGVLQDIFYGTVANQKIGTNISVGTALPS